MKTHLKAGQRQDAAARAHGKFEPGKYVRTDVPSIEIVENLEVRARGYGGGLRELLCTAASMLRPFTATATAPEKPVKKTSKRNLEPGRLSGGERDALKAFVHMAGTEAEMMVAGRALITKVRARALGQAESA